MTPEEFDDCFNRFRHTAVRLETLQDYTPCEPEEVAAFLDGRAQPEESVRTSPWLARIAVTTITGGKLWARVRVVEEPWTDYTRYELGRYIESQACGEQIRITRRNFAPVAPAQLREDFWLFDAGTRGACALAMRYQPDGTWLGADLITEPGLLGQYERTYAMARAWSEPLNLYLAQHARTAAA